MAKSRYVDDATSAATSVASRDEVSVVEEQRRGRSQKTILNRLFKSCEKDAVGSVHRAWALAVLFMLLFFVFAILEGKSVSSGVCFEVSRLSPPPFKAPNSHIDTSKIQANKLREDADATLTLQVAAYYSAFVHLLLMILGTFVLKRFSTAFTVGCFLGVTLILSQQNLLMFAAFFNYSHGDGATNKVFANLSLMLFLCLGFFTLIMGHFKDKIIVA